MKLLNLWGNVPKRAPLAPFKPIVPLGVRKDPKPAGVPSRARIADTDGRARRRSQLVEDNRLR
ncbi:hypothetical protein [Mesorhizobium sp. KR9-304]|uniref:hypothetical protein n=1 Tax=Mesorhizobium sp. KR9-304 TaxID=3156614 RepID=UPI0032B40723